MDSGIQYTGKAVSMPFGLTMGAVISLATTLMGSVVMAKLLDLEKINWNHIGYGIMVLLMISAFVGSAAACMKIKRRKLMVCSVCGAIYWLELLAVTALFFGGQYEAVGVTGLLIMAGSITAAMTLTGERRRKIQKKRMMYR